MKYNKMKLIFSIIFFMFIISAVSANDLSANETVELIEENNAIEINENTIYVDSIWGNDLNDGKTEDTSVKSIETALDLSSDNTTIYLSSGNYTSGGNTKITIDKSVNIIGSKGTNFDGLNKDYLFVVNDNVTVTFKNINFVNAYKSPDYDESVFGSALEIANAKVTIDNCSFVNNSVNRNTWNNVYGGAISNLGELIILNSYFNNNFIALTDLPGGGLHPQGGSIFNKGKIIIKNSSILNSKGGRGTYGVAVSNEGTLEIFDSMIANSISRGDDSRGSAIYNAGDLYLENSIIRNNTISKFGTTFYGAVYNEGTFIGTGNIFQDNKVKNDLLSAGKGSGNVYNAGNLNLTYNAFINNQNINKIARDVYNSGKVISLDNNWWGTNDDPYDDGYRVSQYEIVNSWIIFTLTPSYSPLNISESVLIKAAWQSNSGVCDIKLFPILNTTFKTLDVTKTDELKNGEATFVFNYTQNKGLYEVTADVYGFIQTAEVDVGKTLSNLTYNITDNITFLDNLKINVSLTGNGLKAPTGVVLVKIIGNSKVLNYVIDLANGFGSLEVSNLNPGNYNVEFCYDGDENYFKAFDNTNITIKKRPVELYLTIPSIKIDEKSTTAYILLNTIGAQGYARLYLNDEQFGKPKLLFNGNTTIVIKNMPEGEYNATIEFLGNDQFEAANASTTFKISKYSSTLNIYSHDINVGETESIIIESLPEDLEGYAVLRINGVENEIYIEGQANTTVNISDLGPGLYTAEIIYVGDAKYYGANDTTSFRVIRPNSTLDVNIVKDDHNVNGTITVTTNPLNCTGLIGVYVNYRFYSLNLTEGEAVFNVEFDRGTNYIFVYYEGNDYYEGSTWNTTLGVADEFIFIGENITCFEHHDFNYSVRLLELNGIPMPNREIIIELGDDSWNITTDEDGFAYLNMSLKGGVYTIFATYQNETINNTLIIKAIEYDISVNDINCGETEVIEVTCDENLTGIFNLVIDDILDVKCNITDGKVSYNLTGLTGGKYTLNVRYMNDKYNSSQISKQFNVKKLDLDLKVSFSQNESSITVDNFANATGNVSLIIDNIEYTCPIINSEVVLVKLLDEGDHTLRVNYNGDGFYNSCRLNTTINVKILSTYLLLSINDAFYGKDLTVVANVDKNASGIIRFSVANLTKEVSLNNGVAKWTFTGLYAGNYTIDAIYLGNAFYAESQNSTEFKVLKYESEIILSVNDSVYADNVTAIAKVSQNATGIVRFNVDNLTKDVEIENGVAKWSFRGLDTGNYTISAVYLGNTFYTESQDVAVFEIFKYNSNIVLSINDAIYAENLTAVVNVNKNATGIIRFSVENLMKDVEIENGVAKWTFTGINAGNHIINATYLGNDYYFESQNTTSVKISKANSSIFLYVNEALLNENIRIFANLSTNATGSVLFSMKDYYSPRYKNIYDSQSMWYISPLDTGSYEVFASYPGDINYYPSNTTYILKIYQKKSILDVKIDDVRVTDRVVVKIQLKNTTGDSIRGIVNLQVNGQSYDIDVDGQTGFVIGKLPADNYTFSAKFDGNDEYAKSSVKGSFEVIDSLLNVVISANNLTKFYKGPQNLLVSLKTTKNKAVEGVNVFVTINGVKYNLVSDSNGQASLPINLASGNYTALISIDEDDFYHNASTAVQVTVLPTVEAIDLIKLYGTSSQYFAIFSDSNGKVLGNTKVKFTIGSNSYTANTLPNGICRLNINIAPGTYNITAINPVTGESTTNKLFIFNYLMENKSLTQYFGAKKNYSVRAYNSDGKPAVGVIVNIKVHGVTYKVKTDKNGYAKLTINLYPGTYTIKASYKGVTVSDKIIVKKVLTAKNVAIKKGKTIKFSAKLVNTKGKALKDKKITFKFKGKTYTAKTNKKGIATVKIKKSLSKGKYTIVSKYGKSKITNTIRIK